MGGTLTLQVMQKLAHATQYKRAGHGVPNIGNPWYHLFRRPDPYASVRLTSEELANNREQVRREQAEIQAAYSQGKLPKNRIPSAGPAVTPTAPPIAVPAAVDAVPTIKDTKKVIIGPELRFNPPPKPRPPNPVGFYGT